MKIITGREKKKGMKERRNNCTYLHQIMVVLIILGVQEEEKEVQEEEKEVQEEEEEVQEEEEEVQEEEEEV